MNNLSRRLGAEAYAALLEQVSCGGVRCAAAAEEGEGEDAGCCTPLPSEMELQGCWLAGLLGCSGESVHHGFVRVVDFGVWNRGEGPDFLRAEIELNGRRLCGDVELDLDARNWEKSGHGSCPDYDRVVLHVVVGEVPEGWFTRNSRHEEVPVLCVDPLVCRHAVGYPEPLAASFLDLCSEPLAHMPLGRVESFLQAAAFYRVLKRRMLFRRKAGLLGVRQAWYEAWAESLGYRVNKVPMLMLAKRAPLRALGEHAEAVLLGTAGFLVPVLPAAADSEARHYHRRVWDEWWPLRERFALSSPRCIPWVSAPVRPLNHPHRRVAALALAAQRWREVEPLLCAACSSRLAHFLASLRHPYWSRHCTLPSVPLARDCALVGRDRARDFLINHVFVLDESDLAWRCYLEARERRPAARVCRVARRLFGSRRDVDELLQFCYVQQALLQIDADFCCSCSGGDALFPVLMQGWGM